MSHNRLKYLLKKHFTNNLNITELEELLVRADELSDEEFLKIWNELIKEYEFNNIAKDRIHLIKDNVFSAINPDTKPIKNNIRIIKWLVAATFTAALTFSTYIYLHKNNTSINEEIVSNDIQIQLDSLPKLYINGESFHTSNDKEKLLKSFGVNLSDTANSFVDLTQIQTSKLDNVTVFTPKGYTSKLNLPDGSLVWLNSNTSLSIADDYNGKDRKVKLVGEAYFEVMPNTKPFIVDFNKGEVEVLGTHFNVSAYNDYTASHVSLLEGKVEVRNDKNSLLLSPGYTAHLSSEMSAIKKTEFLEADILAWTNGDLSFNEMDIEEILTMLKQWYDIEDIRFQTQSSIKLSGTFKKSKSLRQVLNHIEKISNHKFHIQGRRVIVET